MRHIIIGAGPAGISAARRIKAISPKDEVIILSRDSVKPYSRMVLPYMLCGEASFEVSLLSVPEGVKLLLGEEVIKIDPKNRLLETRKGSKFSFDTLLIASGANPFSPDVKSSFSFTVRNVEDIKGIKEAIVRVKDKPVILAGAGLVNMEIADALYKMGIPFTFVVRSDRLLSQILDSEASKIFEGILLRFGCDIFKGEDITEVEETREGIIARLSSRKVVSGSCVIFGKGVKPASEILGGTGIKVNRGVVVDEFMQTNVEGIYAAGDVAETRDIVFGDDRLHAIWPLAVEQGKVAGSNMAGLRIKYKGSVTRNIANILGRTIFTGGMSVEDRFDVIRKKADGEYKKVALRDGVIVGFIFIGEIKEPGAYIYAIENEIKVTPFLDKVLDGSLSVNDFRRKIYVIL